MTTRPCAHLLLMCCGIFLTITSTLVAVELPNDQEQSNSSMASGEDHRGQKYDKRKKKWISEEEYYSSRGYAKYHGSWMAKSRIKKKEKQLKKVRASIKKFANWNNAYVQRSKYFNITTNTSPQISKEVAQAMDLCFERLSMVLKIKGTNQKFPIELYATQSQFIEHSGASSPNILGFYWYQGSKRGIKAFYAGSVDQTLSTMFHECTHLVNDLAFVSNIIPTWSNEGMAVLFEDAKRLEKSVDIQSIPFRRLWNLKDMINRNEVDLQRLITMPHAGYSGTYYPQGWGLVYYLVFANNGKYLNGLSNMYGVLKKRQIQESDNLQIFKDSTGLDPLFMFDEWRRFILDIEPSNAVECADAALASISWSRFTEAEEYLKRANDLNPKDHNVIRANAYVKLRAAQWSANRQEQKKLAQESAEYYKKFCSSKHGALKKNSKNLLFRVVNHVNHAKALIYAGRDDDAVTVIENVLDIDFYSSEAYRALALMHITSEDNNIFNPEEAEHNLAVASDLGRNHENMYLEALLAYAIEKQEHEENTSSSSTPDEFALSTPTKKKIRTLLQQASNQDRYGFGARFYQREQRRLTRSEEPRSSPITFPNKKGEMVEINPKTFTDKDLEQFPEDLHDIIRQVIAAQ